MVRHSRKSLVAELSILLILSGCTTTTRVPVDVAIPPVPAATEGPAKTITGYVARENGFHKLRGTASAVGTDSIRIMGETKRAAPLGSPDWEHSLRPDTLLVLSRGEVASVSVEKGSKLKSWGFGILVFGVIITFIAVTTESQMTGL